MHYRTLGKTNYKVSEIGFGAWAIGGDAWGKQDDRESIRALHAAIDAGVNFIDTAQGYGNGHSEELIGKVIRERKEDIKVATKTPPTSQGVWPPSPYDRWQDRYGEDYLRKNVEQRLRKLGVECIDLLQLHSWTRAWNRDPQPLLILKKLKEEGKIAHVGISTPEQDQNSVIDLMRNDLVDTVQVIFNIFEQEPAAELLPVAQEKNVGIIVRVALEEGALTGKFTKDTKFGTDDFRHNYFRGNRILRVVDRVEKLKAEFGNSGYTLAELALRFALDHPAVSAVIAGMRSVRQVEMNTRVSGLKPLPEKVKVALRKYNWLKTFWHS
ncbi:MAG: aldo/keto reductase [Verrucomicrobiae bacterium]|nr:aldo/keto reductase [Verrucomicrobiae bacterium]